MLADIFKTPIVDIKDNFVPHTQPQKYSNNEKFFMISENGIEKTFFIYESSEFLLYWNFTITNIKLKNLI